MEAGNDISSVRKGQNDIHLNLHIILYQPKESLRAIIICVCVFVCVWKV